MRKDRLPEVGPRGAEYDLLQKATRNDLEPYQQVFVEFHHHCTSFTMRDTERVVACLRGQGLQSFSLDDHNYLFVQT